MAKVYTARAITFTPPELALLEDAAQLAGLSLNAYVRQAALNAMDRPPATYTPTQLSQIHRQAKLRGKTWSETELRERGLPLYWSRDWLLARRSEGATYASLAVRYGYRASAISVYARRNHDLPRHYYPSRGVYDEAQELIDAGASVREVAMDLGLASSTVRSHVERWQTERGRVSRERIAAIKWPATTATVTAVVGNKSRAATWIHNSIKAGRLVRIARGVYTTPGGPADIPPGMRAGRRARGPSRYASVDWSLSNREIAGQLGVSDVAVGQARKRLGAPRAKHGWRVRRSEVAALLDAGLTVAEAAVRLGLPPEEVRAHQKRIRRDRGLPTDGRKLRPYVDAQVGRDHVDQLVALAQAGEQWPTVKATAAATGASEAAVYNWRRRARERLAQLAGEVEGA